ncbi:putative quinol monooxygenase [Jeotgalibacillus soli]|uniref:Antibiotic biosynthesis monooxygenase n=1 Tax=Jeotgalibacillus soli TaxID=889306 RepID=A0A0C2VM07_9BACL|nr:putative quinol monooxygenase [Jeotgalibacillus soli]KIL45018.1 antibiotic biosynthesis monooxygenase [Jeotgalibacillus soli]
MIVLVAKYQCKLGKGDEVQSYLNEIKPYVEEHEKGCTVYLANRSVDDQDAFLLYEQYIDEAALEAHRETPHFKEIIEGKVIPLLEKREREVFTLVE